MSGETTQASCSAVVTTSQCQKDCLNVINGTAKFDDCGVCNGDGSTCACVEYQIAGEITELTKNFSLQCAALDKQMKNLKKNSCGTKAELDKIRKAMSKACNSGQVQIRSIPTIIGNCDTVCTLCNNEVVKTNVNDLSNTLYKLSRRAISLDIQCAKKGKCQRTAAICRGVLKQRALNQHALQESVKGVHADAVVSINSIPGSTYSCTKK